MDQIKFITALAHYSAAHPSIIPTDAPPCGGIGHPGWDKCLAGTFAMLAMAEDDDTRLRVLGQAAKRFTNWLATIPSSDSRQDEIAAEINACREIIATWHMALYQAPPARREAA